MKSNPSEYDPAKQDLIAKEISSATGGFHPSKTDLTASYKENTLTVVLLYFAHKWHYNKKS